ncbi:hypothetical protein [Leptonema illini]|uniref:hypothetical protein n=1 Tax=Leptonema illini TaxID=183 RepID=UPI00117B8A10|nr:hypothetical protein [Leptonema illini]
MREDERCSQASFFSDAARAGRCGYLLFSDSSVVLLVLLLKLIVNHYCLFLFRKGANMKSLGIGLLIMSSSVMACSSPMRRIYELPELGFSCPGSEARIESVATPYIPAGADPQEDTFPPTYDVHYRYLCRSRLMAEVRARVNGQGEADDFVTIRVAGREEELVRTRRDKSGDGGIEGLMVDGSSARWLIPKGGLFTHDRYEYFVYEWNSGQLYCYGCD